MKKTKGVEDASVSYEKGEARIRYDDQKITVARLREVINGTGFKAMEERSAARASAWRDKRRSENGRNANERERTMTQNTPAARSYSEDLAELRARFNADKGKVRLLMLLSPT